MKIFQLHAAEDIRLDEKPKPEPRAGEVLVEPKYTGICGSDVHYYKHGYCGRFVPKRPFALGHEFAGMVCQVGNGVQGLKAGDEVAIDPSMPCGSCEHCHSGHYNLCPSMKYFGSASCDPHLDGSLAQYVAVPAANCHILPGGISLSRAALLEPLCVALHAVDQVELLAGASVLITGGGPIGQLILRVARAFDAGKIALSDVDSFAREFAGKSGADTVVNPLEEGAWDACEGYDVVFEASGVPSALATGLEVAHRGGTLVLVGTLPEEVTLPANLIMSKQLKVFGSFRFAHVFEKALTMVAAGKIDLDGMVTDTYGFDAVPQAMQRALSKDKVMKVEVAS